MPAWGKSRGLSLLLIGAGLMPVIAQATPPATEIRLERLSLEHGLTQSSVFALAEDSQG